MARQSLSPQEPKQESVSTLELDPSSEVVGVQRKTYQVVGLELSDHMPIRFNGVEYNLASLTAEQVDYLLQFPEQVPYLKVVD